MKNHQHDDDLILQYTNNEEVQIGDDD